MVSVFTQHPGNAFNGPKQAGLHISRGSTFSLSLASVVGWRRGVVVSPPKWPRYSNARPGVGSWP